MKKLIAFLVFIALQHSLIAQFNIIEKDGLKYLSNRIIVKFKESNDGLSKVILPQTLSDKLSGFGVTSIERRFPRIELIENSRLNNIYSLNIQLTLFLMLIIKKRLLQRESGLAWYSARLITVRSIYLTR